MRIPLLALANVTAALTAAPGAQSAAQPPAATVALSATVAHMPLDREGYILNPF
jgi:hypothetical protein